MKKHTTIISILAALVVVLAVFFMFSGMRHSSLLDKTTTEIKDSDAAVKVFLEEMIPHHQEAVDTSLLTMNDADITNPEIRTFAARVYDKQSFEIAQMKTWYLDWFGVEYGATTTLLQAPYEPMMGDLTQVKGDNLGKAYLQNMITHHKHAIATAQEIRAFIQKTEEENSTSDGQIRVYNSHPGIDQALIFTKQIEVDQSKEVEEMKKLQETI